MFAFTSMGGKIDNAINRGSGPYVFRMNGQSIHRIGSLLPTEGRPPVFAQLYIYDTEHEINNRIQSVHTRDNKDLDPTIVELLRTMLDSTNVLVQLFRTVRDRVATEPVTTLRLQLKNE